LQLPICKSLKRGKKKKRAFQNLFQFAYSKAHSTIPKEDAFIDSLNGSLHANLGPSKIKASQTHDWPGLANR
jgi:hypothetical protein